MPLHSNPCGAPAHAGTDCADCGARAIETHGVAASKLPNPPTRSPSPPPPPPAPPPSPPPPPPTAFDPCTDTCATPNNGLCDDGGMGAVNSTCILGTDCLDCGPRAPGDVTLCSDACATARNGACEDGGRAPSPGNACPWGTDCHDCGPRFISTHPARRLSEFSLSPPPPSPSPAPAPPPPPNPPPPHRPPPPPVQLCAFAIERLWRVRPRVRAFLHSRPVCGRLDCDCECVAADDVASPEASEVTLRARATAVSLNSETHARARGDRARRRGRGLRRALGLRDEPLRALPRAAHTSGTPGLGLAPEGRRARLAARESAARRGGARSRRGTRRAASCGVRFRTPQRAARRCWARASASARARRPARARGRRARPSTWSSTRAPRAPRYAAATRTWLPTEKARSCRPTIPTRCTGWARPCAPRASQCTSISSTPPTQSTRASWAPCRARSSTDGSCSRACFLTRRPRD